MADTKQKIIDEAMRIEEDSLYSAKRHFNASASWGRTHLGLAGTSAVLAAIAGASSFAKFDHHGLVAGILALIASILSTLNTFLKPGERSKSHQVAGGDYNALRNRARIFHQIEVNQTTVATNSIEELKKLSERRDKLNKDSPQTSHCDFEKARKGIEEGEAKYQVDNK